MGCISSKSKDKVTEPAHNAETTEQAVEPSSSESKTKEGGTAAPSGLREASEKPLIIFVIGGPGSGKGTQCKKIIEKYGGGCRHLSTGDLLRAEVEKGSDLGKALQDTMKSGALVSDEQVIALLEKEISATAWFGLAFLVDGFPRAVSQAKKFDKEIRPCDLVLYFECPEDVMLQRLTERGKSSGRQDDNPDTVKERLRTFQQQSFPVADFYAKQGKLHTISAVPPPEEVFQKVAEILDKKFDLQQETLPNSEESSEWRPKQVVDIENRFYGARD